MKEVCPGCRHEFEREPGYWVGALIINTTLIFGLFLIVFLGGMLLTWPDVPWTALLVVLVITNLTIPILFYPQSKTLWVAAELGWNPVEKIGEFMTSSNDAATKITEKIEELDDWRGETLARVRQLIHEADPEMQEEWKWEKPTSGGTPVFSHHGNVCTGETYKEVVKLTFFKGASLDDTKGLFNSSLEGKTRRAIDIGEGEKLDESAFKDLIRAAVAANSSK